MQKLIFLECKISSQFLHNSLNLNFPVGQPVEAETFTLYASCVLLCDESLENVENNAAGSQLSYVVHSGALWYYASIDD